MENSHNVPQKRVFLETKGMERVNPTSEKPKHGRGILKPE